MLVTFYDLYIYYYQGSGAYLGFFFGGRADFLAESILLLFYCLLERRISSQQSVLFLRNSSLTVLKLDSRETARTLNYYLFIYAVQCV